MIVFLAIEIVLHALFATTAILIPLKNKWLHGGNIVIPVFKNGVIESYEFEGKSYQGRKTPLYYIRRSAKLIYQGFTLEYCNEGYNKLRNYRLIMGTYEPTPFIPYVRKAGLKRVVMQENGESVFKTTDENGFVVFDPPDQKKPAMTIMALGGSTTDSPYPYFLWKYLNQKSTKYRYRVINAALAAFTTADNIAMLAFRAIDYSPDVVVFYEASNDIYPSYVGPEIGHFKSDYSHWRTSLDMITLNRYRLFDYGPRFLDYSALYSIFRRVLLLDTIRRLNGGIMAVTARYFPDPGDPQYFSGLSTYKRNIVTLLGIVRIHGGSLLLLTQTHQIKYMSHVAYEYVEQMNDVLRQIARENKSALWFYDFAREKESQIDQLMIRDSVHFDNPGYRLLGESVGRFIIKRVEKIDSFS
ncbi:MAG: SGNH/GDSL hydrolase family protein [Elusimicrobia bacterium]|nr:SGNH/GDSL hydrolase family protein [Candidatus Obscuribacterium magneticum]